MKKFLFLIIMFPGLMFSQEMDESTCVGNCEDGVGTWISANGFLIEDGSFKNGQLHGIGSDIMYRDDGSLLGTYSGEYVNGTYSGWGTAVEYDEEGRLEYSYTGEWYDNDYNGWGIKIYDDKSYIKGLFVDGVLEKEYE